MTFSILPTVKFVPASIPSSVHRSVKSLFAWVMCSGCIFLLRGSLKSSNITSGVMYNITSPMYIASRSFSKTMLLRIWNVSLRLEILPTVRSKNVPKPRLFNSSRSWSPSHYTKSITSSGLQPKSRLIEPSSSDETTGKLDCRLLFRGDSLSLFPYKKQWLKWPANICTSINYCWIVR